MLHTITANLMVESVEDSLNFYKTVLGFTEVASIPNEKGKLQFAIVEKDTQKLMFQERENLGEEYLILATEKVKPSISLFLMVDDFSDFRKEVQSRTKLLVEEHTTFYGTKEFAIADNSGYVITVAEKV
ncbi:VOC family protein [Lachnospiraceae bacterium ZAX-1]